MKHNDLLRTVLVLGAIHLMGCMAVAADAAASPKIATLEFLRLTGMSGNQSIYVEATTEGGVTGRYTPYSWPIS